MRIVHRTLSVLAFSLAGAVAGAAVVPQAATQPVIDPAPGHVSDPVNRMCPIGQEPIDPTVATIEYKGQKIGFCCDSCDEEFLALSEKERDAWVALAVAGKEPGEQPHEEHEDDAAGAHEEEIPLNELYSLRVCPISGQALGSMGEPIVKTYEGREVRFCCDHCPPTFEKDVAASWKKIDEKIVEDQLPLYPVDKCMVSGMPVGDKPNNVVYHNRLVQFCCTKCPRKFEADPESFLETLDKAVIEKQGHGYPLTTCPVSGDDLGSMDDSVNIVVGGRLIRLCCEDCEDKVRENPGAYVEMIDKAWKEKGAAPGDKDDSTTAGS